MHSIHHGLGFMQTRDFNLTFPICDALFGTSDLDRSLVGTLFNGASHDHMRADIRSADPDLSATSIEEAERRTRARLA